VEEAFAGIVALHPAVRAIRKVAVRRWRKAIWSPATWREIRNLRQNLRNERYDLVLDAQGLLKSAAVARLAGASIAGLDKASAREPIAARFYQQRYGVPRGLHAIERTRRLFGLTLGYEPNLSRPESGIVAPRDGPAMPAKAAFLLHGTSREDKKWPASDWTAAARLLAAKGFSPVTTWSNTAEKGVAEAVAQAVPQTLLIPKSPLSEIANRIGRSELVVGADTGLTHLAAAFGLPTVAVFLTTEPALTGPRGRFTATFSTMAGVKPSPTAVVAEAERLLALKAGA
jgi:heptosyltransferase-1